MIKLYKEWVEQKRLANVQTKIDQFKELDQIPYLSKRFILQTMLGLTEEQLDQNDKLWAEENGTVEDIANGI
jgi:hypothetical protein